MAVRELVRRALPDAVRVERPHNLGLARSVISAVDDACAHYGAVIVLEDDCLVSRSFLTDMTWAIEAYRHEPRVMHVAGYAFPTEVTLPETYFLRPAAGACWGWATWADAWAAFQPEEAKILDALTQLGAHYEFNLRKSARFSARLKAQGRRRDQSWATRWYASIFLNGGLCLRYRDSRVLNLGVDGSGEHDIRSNAFDVPLHHAVAIEYPHALVEDDQALEAVIAFHRSLRPNYEQHLPAGEEGTDDQRRGRLKHGLPGRAFGRSKD